MRAMMSGLVLASLGGLAGCSSGGGAVGGVVEGGPSLVGGTLSAEQMMALGDGLASEIDQLDFSDPAGLPTSGEAVYEGAIAMGAYIDRPSVVPDFLVGQVALGVDFSDGGVDGQAGSFRGSDDEAYDGTLAIDGGWIDRGVDPEGGGWTYGAGLAGTLGRGGDRIGVAADLVGDFYGADHGHASGQLENGVIRGSDGTSFAVDGAFVAEQR